MRTSCLCGCICTYGHPGTWGWGDRRAPANTGLCCRAVILSAGSGPGRQGGALFCPKVLQVPLGRNPLPTSQPGWGRVPKTQSRWGVPDPRPGWGGAVFPEKACGRCSHPSNELHVIPHTSTAVRLSGCPAVWAFLSRRRAGGRAHPKGTEPLSCHTHTPNGLSTSRPPVSLLSAQDLSSSSCCGVRVLTANGLRPWQPGTLATSVCGGALAASSSHLVVPSLPVLENNHQLGPEGVALFPVPSCPLFGPQGPHYLPVETLLG